MSNKTRNFGFTNYNLNSEEVFKANDHLIKYLAFGLEHCPSTGRPHHQGFMVFFNPRASGTKNLDSIGNMFKLNNDCVHTHIYPLFGSLKANEKYCSKESELEKFGEPPTQGARKDLNELRDRIIQGTSVDDIAVENPIMYHQYGRTMHKLEAIALRKKFRTEMTLGIWFFGPTGVGKSHEAFKDFHPDTHYVKNLNEDWWDGYKGQGIVILNEFRGQMKFAELLDLLDKYPKTVKIRNQEPVPFLAKYVLITSCKHPSEIYVNCGEHIDQLYRRCTIMHKKTRDSEFEIFDHSM